MRYTDYSALITYSCPPFDNKVNQFSGPHAGISFGEDTTLDCN